MDFKKVISNLISSSTGLGPEFIYNSIEIPPDIGLGDYAFPCFSLAKQEKRPPNAIAADIAKNIHPDTAVFSKIESAGGYVNFFLNRDNYAAMVVNEVISAGEAYGSSGIGKGKTITIDFSSPNIAKPFHVGHLSSTAIGNSLYKIFKFLGYNCIGINHLGDWGTQFGKLITAYKLWGNDEVIEKDPINELTKLYVRLHAEAEKDDSLNDISRENFRKLELGDPECVRLWKKFTDFSMKEFGRIYELLDIHFDSYNGESFYNDKMQPVIDELERKGLVTESEGAKVVDLSEYNMPPCIITKADGATIYATRDLAAAKYRKEKYDFYKNIYVVGSTQSLHFRQVFTVLKLMGYEWYKDCVHVGFGLVKFPDRKMSTRKGDVVLLEDLFQEAYTRSLQIINEKNPDLHDKENAAKVISTGAVVFAHLKNSREKDITFSWDDILNYDGETCPYIQYTYVRTRGILEKSGQTVTEVFGTENITEEEFVLARLIDGFKDSVLSAAERYEPSYISRQLLDICNMFNKFYAQTNIINSPGNLRQFRLGLVKAAGIVISNGLSLLGIGLPDRM